MTIEIHEPELEALIRRSMETGRFRSVEDVLLQALRSSVGAEEVPQASLQRKNFAEFIMESPLRASGLDLERVKDYPRDIEL
jgi:hypothetical protein